MGVRVLRSAFSHYIVSESLLLLLSYVVFVFFFFFSSRRRHTRSLCDWSSDVCSSDLNDAIDYQTPKVMPCSPISQVIRIIVMDLDQ